MVVVAQGKVKMEGQGGQMFVALCSTLYYGWLTRLINVIIAFPSLTVPSLLLGEIQVLIGLTC